MPTMQISSKYTLRSLMLLSFFTINQLAAQNSEVILPVGNYYTLLYGDVSHLVDRIDIKYPNTYQYLHTSVKPFLRMDVVMLALQYEKTDSAIASSMHHPQLYNVDKFNSNYLKTDNDEFILHHKDKYYQGDLFNFFYSASPSSFYQFFTIKINPVIHTDIGFSTDSSGIRFLNTRGVELRGSIDDKVGFYLYATDNQAKFPAYVQEHIVDHYQVVPGESISKIFKETGSDFSSTHGYFGFKATRHIDVQFGQDKIFIGDGIRSLIWSDHSKDFLFLKLNTKVWRFNYQNVFAELSNVDGSNIYNSLVHKKYAAMHHLSVQLTKKINIGAFETIIFDRTDPGGNPEGFELYYLNPVIFYRAVESGLGSGDNAVIGTNWKWNFLSRFSFYGQFILDEFVFDELFGGDGWWGNKYGAQFGLKYIDAFHISNLDLQYEHNFVRPYTYSYDDLNGSSYTHYAEPLSHPLGSNFREHIISLWYQPVPKIVIHNQFINAGYGADTSGSNWGGNIFKDYNTYEQAYGNEIGQGVENQLMLNDLVISWQFWPNVFVDGRVIYRSVQSDVAAFERNETYFSIGIRMNDILRRYDY